MGAYDCDCINNLEYDRRERKQKEQSRSTVSTAQSTAQSTDLIDRQAALEIKFSNGIVRRGVAYVRVDELVNKLKALPTIQPVATDTNVGDTISRQWLMECANEGWIKFDTEKDENRFIHLVRDIAPSAQPERKKGEWSDGYRWQRCSLCKQTGKKSWNYCPNCGADMRGEKDG